MAGESFLRGMTAQRELTPIDQYAQLGSILGSHLGGAIGNALMLKLTEGKRKAKALQDNYDRGKIEVAKFAKIYPLIPKERYVTSKPMDVDVDMKQFESKTQIGPDGQPIQAPTEGGTSGSTTGVEGTGVQPVTNPANITEPLYG